MTDPDTPGFCPSGTGMPTWASAIVPDELVALLNELLAVPWAERIATLSGPRSAVLFTPEARAARVALRDLFADNPRILELLDMLDEADQDGLEPLLLEMSAAAEHDQLLRGGSAHRHGLHPASTCANTPA